MLQCFQLFEQQLLPQTTLRQNEQELDSMLLFGKYLNFFSPLKTDLHIDLFLMVSAVSIREKKMFLIKFPNPTIVRGHTYNMKT